MEKLNGKVALVTGASSGIGKVTALYLAERGYYVFAGARRLERLEEVRGVNLEPLALDVTSDEAVESAMRQIMARKGRLDVLVNNAGYGLYGVLEEVAPPEAERQFAVNVFGLMRMTQAALPVMRAQGEGYVVNLSSVAGKFATPMAGWYSASKHAVEALSDALRAEVAAFGIKVVLIEPGAIKTEFDEVALGELTRFSRLEVYRKLAQAFAKLVQNSYRKAPGPEIIARTIYSAVETRKPRTRYALPADSRLYIFLRGLLSDRLLDRLILGQLRG